MNYILVEYEGYQSLDEAERHGSLSKAKSVQIIVLDVIDLKQQSIKIETMLSRTKRYLFVYKKSRKEPKGNYKVGEIK